ncbi:MAG: DNA integrity scanning protein DisA, partial [Gemmatimonadetes bacterium HGW-Gemmatimonadetes-1]
MESSLHSTDSELPDVALPMEAVFQAVLDAQYQVPFEQSATNGAAAPSTPAGAVSATAGAAPVVSLPANAVQLKGPANALARNMDASLAIPTATTFREIPVRVLEGRRSELNNQLKAAGRSEKLSFTHLIAWALVEASKSFPVMGTGVIKSGTDTYKLVPEHLNLGLAVDVERKDGSRGLMVPVLKAAETLDFAGFLATYDALVEKARTNKLMPDDFAGTTMTLTNPGGLGTVSSVPRLMPGQGTIIATGSIAYPPEFAGMSKEQIAALGIGKVMMLTSTYDHRVIQGAESGAFLRLVDQLLQGEHGFYENISANMGLAAPSALPGMAPVAAGGATQPAPGSAGGAAPSLHHVAAAMALTRALRTHGHLAAHLDPLGTPPVGDPALEPASLGLSPEVMATIPADVLRIAVPGATLADAYPHLVETYCGTIAYEVEHIASHEKRVWLRQQIEGGTHRIPLGSDDRRALLTRLTQTEGMEQFLHKAYLGAKRFSIEGLDMMISSRMGALIVVGHMFELEPLCSGGFAIGTAFTPQRLFELSKMDGAIVLDAECERILKANVHLVPDAALPTSETGMRHRTAERLSRQTNSLAIAISHRRNVVNLYLRGTRVTLDEIEVLLAKANQAIQTLQNYRQRLDEMLERLTLLEFEDLATLGDVAE